MTRKIIVRPEAEAEVQAAFDWYEEQSDGLGFEFLRAMEACLSGVTRNSISLHGCSRTEHQTRSCQGFSIRSFLSV